MTGIITELKRRNVFKVATAYAVVSWLILQVCNALLPNLGLPEWTLSFVTLLLLIGFPIALLFAWAFELTPLGIKRSKEVSEEHSILHITGRKLDFVIIGALVLIIGGLAYERLTLKNNEPLPDGADTTAIASTSIAVLPFVNMSSDPEQKYFSDGISDEILNVLAQIPGLHVTSRSSAFQFRGDNIHIPTVAKQLGVANVLEGSVRKSGNRIKITAQLIDAVADKHLWSQTYERDLTDIFAVQDEISRAIVEAMKAKLGIEMAAPIAPKTSINTEAHNQYLLGVYNMELRGKDPLLAAIGHLERAVALEPEYAEAHARLSMSLGLLPTYASEFNFGEYMKKARPHAEKAFELAPESWEANLAMGYNFWLSSLIGDPVRRIREAIKYFNRAIALNPSYGTAYAWLSRQQENLALYEEQLATLEASLRVDPLARIPLNNLSEQYALRGRFKDSLLLVERLNTIDPALAYISASLGNLMQGHWADEAITRLKSLALRPSASLGELSSIQAVIGYRLDLPADAIHTGKALSEAELHILLGNPDQAVLLARKWHAQDQDLFSKYTLGTILVIVGEMEEATPLLEGVWQEWAALPSSPAPIALVAARMAAGDETEARALVTLVRKRIAQKKSAEIIDPQLDIDQGLMLYLVGDRQAGLTVLADGVRRGGYVPPWPVPLADLMADADFAPILAMQNAKQKRERHTFLTLMCGDQNPVADSWQPLPATCADFEKNRREARQ